MKRKSDLYLHRLQRSRKQKTVYRKRIDKNVVERKRLLRRKKVSHYPDTTRSTTCSCHTSHTRKGVPQTHDLVPWPFGTPHWTSCLHPWVVSRSDSDSSSRSRVRPWTPEKGLPAHGFGYRVQSQTMKEW